MRVFGSPHDLLGAAGDDLGFSAWHEVTQQHIDLFADATGDHQWIHTDPVRAARGPFGTTIAHGFLTLSMLPMMMWEVLTVESGMAVNYGLDKVRFPAPTPVGARIRAHVELAEVSETPKGVMTVQHVTVELMDAPRPACVAQAVILFVP